MASQHAYNEIEASLAAIVEPGSVFEIRCLGRGNRKRIDAGYFDSPAAAATALAGLEAAYVGVYLTVNPVHVDMMARAHNRIAEWQDKTTHDTDVLRRRWLLIDIDPKRPSGISSTDREHKAAMNKAEAVAMLLQFEYGWPAPMLNDSGNGAHLLFPLDEANTDEVRDAIHVLLKCLAGRFNDDVCEIDTTVFNAARIWRVPGTWARKGDSIPVRPHRKATVLRSVQRLRVLKLADIQHVSGRNAHLLRVDNRAGRNANDNPVPVSDETKYRHISTVAMGRLTDWVTHFFPAAREYKLGYRISSEDLGRSAEEDLTIHPLPLGIKDFAVADQGDAFEGRRTPVGLLAEFFFAGSQAMAAEALSKQLATPISEFGPLNLIGHNGGPALLMPDPLLLIPRTRFDFSRISNMEDLKRKTFAETKWIIPDVLPTGNIMLAARPKMRKTWLMLQLGIAVATGGEFLDWTCNQGDVLFLALEDNEKRMRSRIRLLQSMQLTPPKLTNFRYWTGGMSLVNGKHVVTNPEEAAAMQAAFPRGQAGVDALEQYLEQYPNTSMIVIDTFQHFRETSMERDIYQRDYNAQMPITQLAARKQVLIVPVHHEKKGLAGTDSGDFLEDVNGSAGITGGSDGVMSIKGRRGAQDETESRKFFMSGRDVPHDFEKDMSFEAASGGWRMAARTDVKVAIRTLMLRHPIVNQQEMASLLPNVSKNRLVQCLTEMKFENELVQTKFGYKLASL